MGCDIFLTIPHRLAHPSFGPNRVHIIHTRSPDHDGSAGFEVPTGEAQYVVRKELISAAQIPSQFQCDLLYQEYGMEAYMYTQSSYPTLDTVIMYATSIVVKKTFFWDWPYAKNASPNFVRST